MAQQKRKPLEGLVVLGVEQYIAGPYCTMLLADAGAEVIKVERPGSGDPRRTIGPYVASVDGKTRVSGGFLQYNRNKKSLSLNLQDPKGKEILKRLAEKADVLVENFKPGTMAKLGLGYEHLSHVNPRLVYAAISGFGQLEEFEGPYSKWPAFDIVSEAMGGVMHMIGFADRPPITTMYGLADTYSGMVTALGIMYALYDRARTGLGQFVDTSMYDAMLALNERSLATYSLTGEAPMRGRETIAGPRGAFMADDGYVALNIPTDDLWRRLATVIGREDLVDDPRTHTGPARAQNDAFLRETLEIWMKGKTKAEVVDTLMAAGVPTGPVHTAKDIFECPHVAARKMLVELDDPDLGPMKLTRTPVRLSDAEEVPGRPVPRLGQHTLKILGSLGYSEQEVAALRQAGVV
jgi:formyl-CoA transferase